MPFCDLALSAPIPTIDFAPPAPEASWGAHIRRRRHELALTQRQVARTLRVDLASLRNWERGRTRVSEVYRPRIIRFLGYDPNPAPWSFPAEIRAARHATGLSQRALARRLGLDPATVRAWEAGRGRAGHERVRQALQEFVASALRTRSHDPEV